MMYDNRKLNFFFAFWIFHFMYILFPPNHYTGLCWHRLFFFLLSELHFQLSISLIFSLLKDSTSSISNTSKVRSSYFFVVIKCNFSLAQESTKKFTIPQLLWFVLHKKKKYYMREKDYGEKSQSISLNYLIFYSDPNEWAYYSVYPEYVQK